MQMKDENIEDKNFILDKCSTHKNNMIKEIVHHNGYRLIFLPPYIYQLNPIDKVFSLLKSKIKSENCMKRKMFLNSIQIKFQEIKSKNCMAFYSHVND